MVVVHQNAEGSSRAFKKMFQHHKNEQQTAERHYIALLRYLCNSFINPQVIMDVVE